VPAISCENPTGEEQSTVVLLCHIRLSQSGAGGVGERVRVKDFEPGAYDVEKLARGQRAVG